MSGYGVFSHRRRRAEARVAGRRRGGRSLRARRRLTAGRRSTRSWRSGRRLGGVARAVARARRPARPARRGDLQLPFAVGDYVDFYSSLEHATNLGPAVPARRRAAAAQLAPPARRLPRPRRHGRRHRHRGRAARTASEAAGRRRELRADRAARHRARARLRHRRPEPARRAGRGRSRSPSTSSASCSSTTGARATSSAGSTSRSARSSASRSRPRSPPGSTPLARSRRTSSRRPPQDPEPLPYLAGRGDWALDIDLEVELNGEVDHAHERARPLLDVPAAARARDRQRRLAPHRRPVRLGHDLRPGARQRGLADRADREHAFLEDGDEVVLRGRAGALELGEVRGRVSGLKVT